MADNTTESLNQKNQKIHPIMLIFVILMALIGLIFAYGGTMTVITCQRTEQVDCTITERLFGLYPVQEQQVTNLLRVSYESETRTSTSSGSGSGRRKGKGRKKITTETTTETTARTTTYYKLVFHADNDSSIKTSENTSYSWTNSTLTEINNFLANSTEKSISARYIRWITMIMAFLFLIIPILTFINMIRSLFRFIIRMLGGQENQEPNQEIYHSKT